jgi:uncharacterized protein YbjT (DUF2867 family)
MTTTIAVAGATGNLGKRTVKALLARGATVVALARSGTSDEKIKELEGLGAKVAVVDMTDADAIRAALVGAACVVSILQGLHHRGGCAPVHPLGFLHRIHPLDPRREPQF